MEEQEWKTHRRPTWSSRLREQKAYHVPEEKPSVQHGPGEPLVRCLQEARESRLLPVAPTARAMAQQLPCPCPRPCPCCWCCFPQGQQRGACSVWPWPCCWCWCPPLTKPPALDALAVAEEAQGGAVVSRGVAPAAAREGEIPDGVAREEGAQEETHDVGRDAGEVHTLRTIPETSILPLAIPLCFSISQPIPIVLPLSLAPSVPRCQGWGSQRGRCW